MMIWMRMRLGDQRLHAFPWPLIQHNLLASQRLVMGGDRGGGGENGVLGVAYVTFALKGGSVSSDARQD